MRQELALERPSFERVLSAVFLMQQQLLHGHTTRLFSDLNEAERVIETLMLTRP